MLDASPLATTSLAQGGSPVQVFGVWIPRRGDNVRCTSEVVFNLGADFTIEIFQKNYSETGDGTSASVSVNYAGDVTGRQTMELLGAKELIRFRLTLERGGHLEDSEVGLLLYRFLEPVWFEAVKV